MTILVTGATGGLGSAFVPLLRVSTDQRVIASGRSNADCPDFAQCDFTDEAAVARLIFSLRPKIIFHLVGSFTGEFERDFQVNTLSAKYILDAVVAAKLETRIVLFGSAAEYGAVRAFDNPVTEAHWCRPVSAYGLTKWYQTELAKYYFRTRGIDVLVARVFNLAIPGLSERLFYGRAEALIRRYKSGAISHLEFGNLEAERDYVDLMQAKDQLLAISEHGVPGEIYNVGSGFPQKVRTVLDDLLTSQGLGDVRIVESTSEAVGRRGLDVPLIYADISKVSHLVGLR